MKKNFVLIYLSLVFVSLTSFAVREHIQAQDVARFDELCQKLAINPAAFTTSLIPTEGTEELWFDLAQILYAGNLNAKVNAVILYNSISIRPTFTPYTRGRAYCHLAWIYDEMNMPEASQNAEVKAKVLMSESIELKVWLAEHPNLRQFRDKRIQLFYDALHTRNKVLKARALIGLGECSYDDGEHKLLDCYLEALKLLDQHDDPMLRATAYIALGDLRHKDDMHPHYVDWYIHGLELLHDLNEYLLIARALIGLGDRGHKDEFHPKTEYFYLRALSFLDCKKDGHVLRARAYLGLGSMGYTDIDHPRSCRFYIKALDELLKENDPDIKAKVYIKIAELQFQTYRDEAESIHYYKKALALNPSEWIARTAQSGLNSVLDYIQRSDYHAGFSN